MPHPQGLPLALHELFRIRGVMDPGHAVPGLRTSMSGTLAMGRLLEVGPISQHELGNWLGLEKSTVSRLVAGLIADGWVEKSPHPDGRRSPHLQLTPAGRAATANLAGTMQARHERILAALSPAERRAAEIAVPALVRALQSELAPSP
jgi:DNA-binding MarR family transcriptional regulator